MNNSIFDIQADFCKMMGNATRLQIIHALREHPMNVNEIAQSTGIGQPVISRHLNTLRGTGVVQSQRHGNEIIYQLTDGNIVEVCDLVRKVLTNRIQKESEVLQPAIVSSP